MKNSVIGVLVVLALTLGAPASGTIIGPGGGGVEGVVTDLGGLFQYDYTVYTGGFTEVTEGAIGTAIEPGLIAGGVIDSFLIPFFDPEVVAIIPGSIEAPPGWQSIFLETSASAWSYNPLEDPDSGNYEVPDDVFINPPFVLRFYADGIIINPGSAGPAENFVELIPITGFSFLSPYGDTNGPVVIGYADGGLISVDPPHVKSPSHPAAVVPEPAGLGLVGLAILGLRKKRR